MINDVKRYKFYSNLIDKNEQDSDAVDNLLAGLGVHLLRAWQLGHLDHDPEFSNL